MINKLFVTLFGAVAVAALALAVTAYFRPPVAVHTTRVEKMSTTGYGVCVQEYDESNNGVEWITGIQITSPTMSGGTVSCAEGSFVAVTPQKAR